MKNIFNKFKINNYTYLFIFLCAICGYIKNITIILLICIFHELGHIFFIKLFNYEIIKIEILPFGGFTTINERINANINKDLLIASGGILAQIILLIVVYLFRNHFNLLTYNLIINYSIILIIFNLLPIIPLDGNKIAHLLLEKVFSYQLSYHLNFYLSLIFLIIFSLVNYFYSLDNYFIISFLIYKTWQYVVNYKYLKKRFLLERCLYNFDYSKIDNHTKDLSKLKKGVLHYFWEDNHYLSEKHKIQQNIYQKD